MTPSRTPPTSSEERFRRAFVAHYHPLSAYAISRLREGATADDVVAEVFTTAWRRVDALPGEPETRPWLFGVARNVLRNVQRSVRRRSRLAGRLISLRADEVPAPEITDDDDLAAAIATLAADDRTTRRQRHDRRRTRSSDRPRHGPAPPSDACPPS